ncbi:MAG: PAS domain S-box protein, partial [Spirochaetaceae bacterium]
RDGTKYQIADSAAPIRDDKGQTTGVVLVFRDVTEEYRIAQALSDSEHDMARAQALGKLGSWRIDLNTGVVIASDQARKIYGVGGEELTMEQAVSLSLPEYRSTVYTAFTALVEDGVPYDIEFRIRRPSDNSVRCIHSVAEYDAKRHRVVGTLQDITDRKMAEEEIRRRLSEKEALLKEVHHRIRNNMAQVESLLSIQADSAGSADVAYALNEAISRVRSIRSLYDKLLIEPGYKEVSLKDYLESLIDSVVDVLGERPGLTVEKRITDVTIGTKKAIPVGIIINELLTNVFKYAFAGRDNGHILITVDRNETCTVLTVRDNGVGIDHSDVENTSPGFGLSLVKMLAEQLEGTFTIEDRNGTESVLQFEV